MTLSIWMPRISKRMKHYREVAPDKETALLRSDPGPATYWQGPRTCCRIFWKLRFHVWKIEIMVYPMRGGCSLGLCQRSVQHGAEMEINLP